MTHSPPLHPLIERQIRKATDADGTLDARKLVAMVSDAYQEKDADRRRSERANRLMTQELEDALTAQEVQNMWFKAALDNALRGLCMFDKNGRHAVSNRRFREIFDIAEEDCKPGSTLRMLAQKSKALARFSGLEQRLMVNEFINIVPGEDHRLEQQWPDGRCITITRLRLPDGSIIDIFEDVTEQRRSSEKIAHLARHDALTDLPNRVLLRERLNEITRNGRRDDRCAILCLDLDRFKSVNDTLGHPVGDALLIQVAARLQALVRQTDVVVRLGGDEFAIIQQHIPDRKAPERLAKRILRAIALPYELGENKVEIGVSIGIDIVDVARLDPDEALRNADLALYQAKADGRGTYRLFVEEMHALATQRRQMEIDLREALALRQFTVYYQAQFDIQNDRIGGFEALVRWRHPKRGIVPPAEFISICEECGLIDRLGAFVLETACRDALRWPDAITVADNLSPIQFRTRKLVDIVRATLKSTGLPPERLELEITESVLLENVTDVLDQLRQIKRLGCHVSLDDFGTGYSSLSYIRHFPFDRVKIDQSFVRELGNSPDSLAIIRAVAGLCGSLGIKSTAEGVETTEQLEILCREHCDSVQGYLFSRPVTLRDTFALLEDHRPPQLRAAAGHRNGVSQVA